MGERQLRLFAPHKPLVERFGKEFFRSVPATPGVYVMSDEFDRVLYVGQSQNLRVRLATYKNANPGQVSRKVIRLVHAVRMITWEKCDSVGQARLRENELLRLHRPKFNVVNTFPEAYCFIGLKMLPERVTLSLSRQILPADAVYGAFKRHAVEGYGALIRLWWTALRQPKSLVDFPCGLLSPKPPRTYILEVLSGAAGRALVESLPGFLEGSDDRLARLRDCLPADETVSPFQRAMQRADLQTLADFFRVGPQRNFRLRLRHGLPSRLIPQRELDNWLAYEKDAEPAGQSVSEV